MGWQRLSAGRDEYSHWSEMEQRPLGEHIKSSGLHFSLFTAQSPGVGTKVGDLTCELNAFKQLLPCQKEAAPAASLENVSDVRRDETRLGSVSVSLLWD